ncbi:hypothetical protein AC1031_011030 [Aphanomyces cochlioides]|nr:hypothetical protein AC1031_011030 [Aphanomyces cochlioides]
MKGEVAYVVVKEKPVKLACLGYVYLTFTLCCSIGYLFLLIEVTKNDHWWREFNTTGAQTFLADVFNSKLHLGQYGSLNLFDVALPKDYSTGKTFVDIQPSVARRLLLDDLPLDVAIQTIRANSLFENIYTVIPYCWVDFDRMFEMAHTARRQERCYVNQRDNAAVYMEALLRNVNSNDLAQSSYGIQINQMILTPITMLPGGPPWISSLPNRTQISLEDEIAFWRQYGLTRYTIQYQNRFQYGLDSSITIVNAFGVTQTMKIHSSPYTDRGSAIWTTRVAFCGIWNDFSSCNGFHCSLVRSSNNSLEAQGRNWDVIYTGGGPSIGGDLMRVALGPYVNWDLHYIPAPPSLVEIFAAFQSHVCKIARLAATADVSPFSGIENADIDIVPPEWRYDGMVYYGANPPCAILATPQTYVQMPFRFDDTCHALSQFSIHINPTSLLFSVVLANVTLDQVPRICSCSLTLASTCATLLGRAIGAIPKIFPLPFTSTDAQTTILDIMGLNILFIQMAARNTTKVLLKQPVISNPPDKWTLFGWIALSDWIDGSREVYTFEGDNGNLTLMSARSPPLQMAASALELPQAACCCRVDISVGIRCMAAD